MNATNYAAKYTAAAMDAYIAYAAETDVRNAALYMERARHYEVLAAAEKERAQREAAQPVAVEAPQVKTVAPSASAKPRCPHYKLIARFFAIAREAGLDTGKEVKPQMRHAMETAMGRCVNSRSEVEAQEWQTMGNLIKAGRLSWA